MVIIILVKAETNRITGILVNHLFYLHLFFLLTFSNSLDRQEENIWINMHYIENVKELKIVRVK